ncbi:MAG TPA: dienelactone hydrolase family protein [Sphingobacteriaceae bacterium]|nr:dienelactone hydrolase family protein [Sphingobacteriaceae bacterium]
MTKSHTHEKTLETAGESIENASNVLIMIHGRGGTAKDILSLASQLEVQDYALLAPQANNNTWYHYSFMAPPEHNNPWLSSAIEIIENTVDEVHNQGIPYMNIYFLGFSQGACLTLEFASRNAKRYGGIVAFTGGLIGDKIYSENYKGDFKGTPVFIGTGDHDSHVPLERVDETALILEKMGAKVTKKVYPDKPHSISLEEIELANALIFNS